MHIHVQRNGQGGSDIRSDDNRMLFLLSFTSFRTTQSTTSELGRLRRFSSRGRLTI